MAEGIIGVAIRGDLRNRIAEANEEECQRLRFGRNQQRLQTSSTT